MPTFIAPASVINDVTDLDKPGEVVEKLMGGIDSDIRSNGFRVSFSGMSDTSGHGMASDTPVSEHEGWHRKTGRERTTSHRSGGCHDGQGI